jgi:hypothetical protein
MASYETTIETSASAEQLMRVLTDPAEIRGWSPVPFELSDLNGETLEAGSKARVSGSLAGMSVGFDVTVHAAGEDELRLTADGPVSLDVAYGLRPSTAGSELSASVRLGRPRGLTSRLIGKATEAMLSAGALDRAASRIAISAEGVLA